MSAVKKVAIFGPSSLVFSHICKSVGKKCGLEGIAPLRVLKDFHKKNGSGSARLMSVPDDMITRLLLESVADYDRCLIYGYPMNSDQAKIFFDSVKLHNLVHLSVDYDYAVKDFDDSYIHMPTRTGYHMKYNKPSEELMKSFNNDVFKKKQLKSLEKYKAAFNDSVERNNAMVEYIGGKVESLKIDNAEDYEAAIIKVVDFIKEE